MIELGLKYNVVPVRPEIDNLYAWYEKINSGLSVPTLKYDQRILTQSNEEIVRFLCEKHGAESDLIPFDEARREKVEKYLT